MELRDIAVGDIVVHPGMAAQGRKRVRKVLGKDTTSVTLEGETKKGELLKIAGVGIGLLKRAEATDLADYTISLDSNAEVHQLLLRILRSKGADGALLACRCKTFEPVDPQFPEIGNKVCSCFALLKLAPRGDLFTRSKEFLLNKARYAIETVDRGGCSYYVLLAPDPLEPGHELLARCSKAAMQRGKDNWDNMN